MVTTAEHTHPVSACQHLIDCCIYCSQLYFSFCLLLHLSGSSCPFWLQAEKQSTSTLSTLRSSKGIPHFNIV